MYDVLVWAAAAEREWDGNKLCVGGQSAGGSLSAAAARLALEQGGPEIKLQMLHYAPLDLVTASKDKRSALGDKAVMRPWMSEVFDTAYIPDPAQRRDRLASPAWGDNADDIAAYLQHYGALFIGPHSAEVLGDYGAGPNHVLPTGGTARFTGGLSVFNFLRVRTWMKIDRPDEAAQLIDDATDLARLEGLAGHARAAKKRR